MENSLKISFSKMIQTESCSDLRDNSRFNKKVKTNLKHVKKTIINIQHLNKNLDKSLYEFSTNPQISKSFSKLPMLKKKAQKLDNLTSSHCEQSPSKSKNNQTFRNLTINNDSNMRKLFKNPMIIENIKFKNQIKIPKINHILPNKVKKSDIDSNNLLNKYIELKTGTSCSPVKADSKKRQENSLKIRNFNKKNKLICDASRIMQNSIESKDWNLYEKFLEELKSNFPDSHTIITNCFHKIYRLSVVSQKTSYETIKSRLLCELGVNVECDDFYNK